MKKLIVLFLLSFIALNAQDRIKNYSSLMKVLTSGGEVRVVVQYAKCKLIVDSAETKAPEATGGMTLNSWEQFAKGAVGNEKAYVTWSENVMTTSRKGTYRYNYVKFRVYEDNTVEINARYISPDKFETIMNETFYGKISDGSDNEGVSFFED